ncbi:MAG: hypothetical protein Q9191_000997 [Dirinaria sp. TL-2023a]
MNLNDSVMIIGESSAKGAKTVKGSKTAAEGRKGNNRTKGKAAKAGIDASLQASSFVEPEDDDFDVKLSEPKKTSRGRKRKSEQMEDDLEKSEASNVKVPTGPPAAKKRATRTRASSVQPPNEANLVVLEDEVKDVHMTDSEAMPPPPPVSKKGGRKKRSSGLRKVSTTSTASMASLRAPVLNDEDIDAVLEADLDRPLTDDEADAENLPRTLPKTRRLTRTRPGSRNGIASIAPARRTTRASTIPTDDIAESELAPEPKREPNPKAKASNSGKARKVSKRQPEASGTDVENGTLELPDEPEKPLEPVAPTHPERKEQRKRQVSHQAPARRTQATGPKSAPDSGNTELGINSSALNSSVLGSRTAEDDSGHETDASLANRASKKRAPKKGTAKGKKSKAGQKAGMMSRNIEDIVQSVAEPEDPVESAVPEPLDLAEERIMPAVEEPENAASKKNSKKKTSKQTRANAAKEKFVTVPSSPPPSQMSELWTDQPLGESTPLQSKRPDISESTPAEASQEASDLGTAQLHKTSPKLMTAQRTPTAAVSPQSSDAENQPPSSRPSALRPPLEVHSPSKAQTIRIPLAASTPTASPSKRNIATSMPWAAVDFEKFLSASPNPDKENAAEVFKAQLTSPEKKLTVEEWIFHNAQKAEERLRNECERLVGRFEGEGVRALKTLEGIVCTE